MSSYSPASLIQGKSSHPDIRESNSSYARDLFIYQTGQALLEIGTLFINIPPFNEHVDRHTGTLLISIGHKLQSRK